MRQPANDFSVMKPAKLLLLCLALFQIPALVLAQSPGASENANSTDEQPANTSSPAVMIPTTLIMLFFIGTSFKV